MRSGKDRGESIHHDPRTIHPEIGRKKSRSHPAGGIREFRLHQSLGCVMVMRLQTVFMANYLPIQFVDQFVHGRIQVSMGTFSKQFNAFDVYIAFSFLSTLFFFQILQGQQYLDIHNLVKMTLDPVQFAGDVSAQRRGNFQVVTTDRQIHKKPPKHGVEKNASADAGEGKIIQFLMSMVPLCPSERLNAMFFYAALQQCQGIRIFMLN